MSRHRFCQLCGANTAHRFYKTLYRDNPDYHTSPFWTVLCETCFNAYRERNSLFLTSDRYTLYINNKRQRKEKEK